MEIMGEVAAPAAVESCYAPVLARVQRKHELAIDIVSIGGGVSVSGGKKGRGTYGGGLRIVTGCGSHGDCGV